MLGGFKSMEMKQKPPPPFGQAGPIIALDLKSAALPNL